MKVNRTPNILLALFLVSCGGQTDDFSTSVNEPVNLVPNFLTESELAYAEQRAVTQEHYLCGERAAAHLEEMKAIQSIHLEAEEAYGIDDPYVEGFTLLGCDGIWDNYSGWILDDFVHNAVTLYLNQTSSQSWFRWLLLFDGERLINDRVIPEGNVLTLGGETKEFFRKIDLTAFGYGEPTANKMINVLLVPYGDSAYSFDTLRSTSSYSVGFASDLNHANGVVEPAFSEYHAALIEPIETSDVVMDSTLRWDLRDGKFTIELSHLQHELTSLGFFVMNQSTGVPMDLACGQPADETIVVYRVPQDSARSRVECRLVSGAFEENAKPVAVIAYDYLLNGSEAGIVSGVDGAPYAGGSAQGMSWTRAVPLVYTNRVSF